VPVPLVPLLLVFDGVVESSVHAMKPQSATTEPAARLNRIVILGTFRAS
jgi:hypothetical protein